MDLNDIDSVRVAFRLDFFLVEHKYLCFFRAHRLKIDSRQYERLYKTLGKTNSI